MSSIPGVLIGDAKVGKSCFLAWLTGQQDAFDALKLTYTPTDKMQGWYIVRKGDIELSLTEVGGTLQNAPLDILVRNCRIVLVCIRFSEDCKDWEEEARITLTRCLDPLLKIERAVDCNVVHVLVSLGNYQPSPGVLAKIVEKMPGLDGFIVHRDAADSEDEREQILSRIISFAADGTKKSDAKAESLIRSHNTEIQATCRKFEHYKRDMNQRFMWITWGMMILLAVIVAFR